jgi:hypothetical protein
MLCTYLGRQDISFPESQVMQSTELHRKFKETSLKYLLKELEGLEVSAPPRRAFWWWV